MAQKQNNTISKVVEWTARIQRQASLIVNHSSADRLIRTLHNEVHGSLLDDDKMSSKKLFQSLVLTYIKDNYTPIYNRAILG